MIYIGKRNTMQADCPSPICRFALWLFLLVPIVTRGAPAEPPAGEFTCSDALQYAQQHAELPLGWVLPEWSEEKRRKALALQPDYLFVDSDFCPQDQAEIWHGPWQWVAFTLNSAQEVAHYAGLGIELIETNRYSELKQESRVDVSNDF